MPLQSVGGLKLTTSCLGRKHRLYTKILIRPLELPKQIRELPPELQIHAVKVHFTFCTPLVGDQEELSRYSKNYLPILFNLYTSDPAQTGEGSREPVLESIKAYASITEQNLLEAFYAKSQGKLSEEDLPMGTRYIHVLTRQGILGKWTDLLCYLLRRFPFNL